MPTAVRSASGSFASAPSIGGGPKIGSIGVKSVGSPSSLASKIGSFQRVNFNSKESFGGSAGLSAKDKSFGSASFKAFNNPAFRAEAKMNSLFGPRMTTASPKGAESKPAVILKGNFKPFSAFGENGSARPRSAESIFGPKVTETKPTPPMPTVRFTPDLARRIDTKGILTEAKKAEVPTPKRVDGLIAFQPDQSAKGAERFSFPLTKSKGFEPSRTTFLIDVSDRTSKKDTIRIKTFTPNIEAPRVDPVIQSEIKKKTSEDETEEEKKAKLKKPKIKTANTTQPNSEKAAVGQEEEASSDTLTTAQVKSLLALEPLVAVGILTKAEAKQKAGITEATSASQAKDTNVVNTQAVDAKQAQELAQIYQIVNAVNKAKAVINTGSSVNVQLAAERAQKLASALQTKTDAAQATSSEIADTTTQIFRTKLKRVVKKLSRKSEVKENSEANSDQKLVTKIFQEDRQAERARIEDAQDIYNQILSQRRSNGEEDDVVNGKEIADRYSLTESKRGRVLRQRGSYQEDGTSIAILEALAQIEEITPEKIVALNQTEGLRPVELVEEIKTSASKPDEVRLTFERNQTPMQVAITEYEEQVIGFDTLEMTTQRTTEASPTVKKSVESDEASQSVEDTEQPEVLSQINSELQSLVKNFQLPKFSLNQRLALVP